MDFDNALPTAPEKSEQRERVNQEPASSQRQPPRPQAVEGSIAELFQNGNYAAVAMKGDRQDWQTYAALGLVGKTQEAVEGLWRFPGPEASFYLAVAHWIGGDADRAVALLQTNPLAHAQRLLTLLRQPQIKVLAQLPWARSGCSDFLTFADRDHAFQVQNISFHPSDLPNQPYADIHRYYDPESPPDFYICAMVEWHLIPPNLQELPCPILGQTGDYDLHLQAVRPWLGLFDEFVVTDPSEWRDVRQMVPVPVGTFPKSFGVQEGLPEIPETSRPIDIFLSGTVLHPYHPDKADLLHQVLRVPDLKLKIINGFKDSQTHYSNLAASKVCVSYVRHPTALPTRGLEALAMGCALVAQKDTVLGLYVGEQDGLLPYELEAGNLGLAIWHILTNWPEFQRRARRGAKAIREEFSLAKVASQYLRFLTFLAARPRPPRQVQQVDHLVQKRCILEKGWLPSYDFNHNPVLRRIGLQNHARLQSQIDDGPVSSRLFIDAARESVLFNHHRAQENLIPVEEWLTGVRRFYEHGLTRFPNSLVLRFNYIRVLIHYGTPEVVSQGLEFLEETLRLPPDHWTVDVMEDVFPWDFHPQFFNYRRYFDLVTEHCTRGIPAEHELVRLILASLHYYRGLYAPYDGYHAGGLEDFHQATLLDPEFPYYKLDHAKRLVERNLLGDHQNAVRLLVELAGNSILFLEAFRLLQQLKQKHGLRFLAHLDLGAWPRLLGQVQASPQRRQVFPAVQAYEQLAAVIRSARDSFEIIESVVPPPLLPDRTRAKARQDQLESRLACALAEVERLRALIRAMKSSKFWKLRTAWLWLKRGLGLRKE